MGKGLSGQLLHGIRQSDFGKSFHVAECLLTDVQKSLRKCELRYIPGTAKRLSGNRCNRLGNSKLRALMADRISAERVAGLVVEYAIRRGDVYKRQIQYFADFLATVSRIDSYNRKRLRFLN